MKPGDRLDVLIIADNAILVAIPLPIKMFRVMVFTLSHYRPPVVVRL
jgi:hypothetical protein